MTTFGKWYGYWPPYAVPVVESNPVSARVGAATDRYHRGDGTVHAGRTSEKATHEL